MLRGYKTSPKKILSGSNEERDRVWMYCLRKKTLAVSSGELKISIWLCKKRLERKKISPKPIRRYQYFFVL